ncbi:transposase DNA-binding-containing protein, partial [Xenorhabdus indica]|uniref:transposase DNA-binding-containing protein n=1 Tax=Xenorhabdus indica TaxID=333964 RepID=UPI003B84966A
MVAIQARFALPCLFYTNPSIESRDFFEPFSTWLISIRNTTLRSRMMFSTDAEQWAKDTFQYADLGDSRRTKRLIKL